MTVSVWVVLLEAADTRSTGGVSYESVQRLLSQLARHHASGLYSTDRYAIQLVLETERPATALDVALTLWHDAVVDCGLPRWELVRAEVKTVSELEAELAAEAAIMGSAWPPLVEDLHSRAEPAEMWGATTGSGRPAGVNGLHCAAFTLEHSPYRFS